MDMQKSKILFMLSVIGDTKLDSATTPSYRAHTCSPAVVSLRAQEFFGEVSAANGTDADCDMAKGLVYRLSPGLCKLGSELRPSGRACMLGCDTCTEHAMCLSTRECHRSRRLLTLCKLD